MPAENTPSVPLPIVHALIELIFLQPEPGEDGWMSPDELAKVEQRMRALLVEAFVGGRYMNLSNYTVGELQDEIAVVLSGSRQPNDIRARDLASRLIARVFSVSTRPLRELAPAAVQDEALRAEARAKAVKKKTKKPTAKPKSKASKKPTAKPKSKASKKPTKKSTKATTPKLNGSAKRQLPMPGVDAPAAGPT